MLLLKSCGTFSVSLPGSVTRGAAEGLGGSCREIFTVGQTLWICSLEYWCLELPSVPCIAFIHISVLLILGADLCFLWKDYQ